MKYGFDLHKAARVLQLLAHGERRQILEILADRQTTTKSLALLARISQKRLAVHLARLHQEGLVGKRLVDGNVHYSVADPKLVELLRALREMGVGNGTGVERVGRAANRRT